jgi:polysaccharide pyruvyl transferase WcaK-like protein
MGITAMNWQAQNLSIDGQMRYEQALAMAARYFVEQCDGRVLFFPQVCGPTADQDDRVPARRVASALAGMGDRVVVVQEALEPDLLKSVYGLMDVFIATRLHSAILAAGSGVPTLAISYHFKTRAIARRLGIEQWVVETGTVEADSLVKCLAELWSSRVAVRADLLGRLPDVKREAERAGALVAADFAEWHLWQGGS